MNIAVAKKQDCIIMICYDHYYEYYWGASLSVHLCHQSNMCCSTTHILSHLNNKLNSVT